MFKAVKTVLWRTLDFAGRSPRSEFWWWLLFCAIVSFGAFVFDSEMINRPYGPASLIAQIVLFTPTLAVTIRRLHDTGHSGWWLLVAFVPVIGWLTLLFWYLKRGSPGLNDFDDAMA